MTIDSVVYRQIQRVEDHSILQQDLLNLKQWASLWQMNFAPSKCYKLSVTLNKKIVTIRILPCIFNSGADPGFSEGEGGWFGQTFACTIWLLFNKSFFHKKEYGQNICVSLKALLNCVIFSATCLAMVENVALHASCRSLVLKPCYNV